MKKNFKNLLKEDGKRLEAIQKSGRDMIEYLKNEKLKLLEKQEAMKAEHRVRYMACPHRIPSDVLTLANLFDDVVGFGKAVGFVDTDFR